MPPRRVHVIGAGMAGLAAAVELTRQGVAVTLYESGVQAGGRCRSYHDQTLDCILDNGNHLLLAGNHAVLSYLKTIGAEHSLTGPAEPDFPFYDLSTGEGWTLRINRGRVPWWVFASTRRVPGTRAADYLEALRLRGAPDSATVADRMKTDTVLFNRLWGPIAIAALNTEIETASASLLWHIFVETFGRGGDACRPLVPVDGLSESLVYPALAWLQQNGSEIRFGQRLRGLGFGSERIESLTFADGTVINVLADEAVILAVPSTVAAELMPGLSGPTDFRAIVNLHYRVEDAAPVPGEASFVGVVGGLAEWVFVKPGVLSVTISAADRLIDDEADDLAARIWPEVERSLGRSAAKCPPWRLVREKRATFAATPAQLSRRPKTQTIWRNLALAGDWTATSLPSTIEGAVRSGCTAAEWVVATQPQ